MPDFPQHLFRGEVRLFPQEGGWYYVAVPKKYTKLYGELADRGLIPVTAQVGETQWNTSLLPKGDGTHFVALKAHVRKCEGIELGDRIQVRFQVRG